MAFDDLTRVIDLVDGEGLFQVLGRVLINLGIVRFFHDNTEGTVEYNGSSAAVWHLQWIKKKTLPQHY